MTPALTHWIGQGFKSHSGHIGILKTQVPEPHTVLLLAVGAAVLVVLRRVSRRGGRARYPLTRLRGVPPVP